MTLHGMCVSLQNPLWFVEACVYWNCDLFAQALAYCQGQHSQPVKPTTVFLLK